ncbi:hypothetical protein LIA77_10949 [Sarocladium implicatum]|nr:hypothetical protein LIA77_10949 [Sarocladium implicatum]
MSPIPKGELCSNLEAIGLAPGLQSDLKTIRDCNIQDSYPVQYESVAGYSDGLLTVPRQPVEDLQHHDLASQMSRCHLSDLPASQFCKPSNVLHNMTTPFTRFQKENIYSTPYSGGNSSFNASSTDSVPRPLFDSLDMDSFTPDTYVFPSPASNSFTPGTTAPGDPRSSPCPQPPSRQLFIQASGTGYRHAAQPAPLPSACNTPFQERADNYLNPQREVSRFRPMDALLCPWQGQPRSSNEYAAWKQKRMEAAMKSLSTSSVPPPIAPIRPATSFSIRYGGQHIESNASADHLLPVENCALWLTNLPPRISYTSLLGAIRGFGRIWCTYINEPDSYEHVTAAAKVVFFKPKAATAFLKASWTAETPLVIDGYRIKVSHNRIKYPEKMHDHGESRVLIVTGHPKLVNEKTLTDFFENRFMFQMDRVRMLAQCNYRNVLEFSFGSYRCQAQMAKLALEKDRPEGFEKAEYAEDPCEAGGESWTSWHIAAERIMGNGL